MSKKTIVKICILALVLLFGVVSITLYYRNLSKSSKDFFGEPIWAFKPQSTIFGSLLNDSSDLILQTSGSIYSLNVDSGKTLWQKEALATRSEDSASMKLSGDNLLMPEKNGIIAVYSEKTGELIWKDSSNFENSWIEDIDVSSNTLYVARYSEYLTAYDLSNGEFLWDKVVPSRTSLYVMPDEDKVYLGTGESICAYGAHT